MAWLLSFRPRVLNFRPRVLRALENCHGLAPKTPNPTSYLGARGASWGLLGVLALDGLLLGGGLLPTAHAMKVEPDP